MDKTLLTSPKIFSIESNYISLFERTFKKGVEGQSGPGLKKSVKTAFSSKTFEMQVDSLIDDICLYTIKFTDKLIQKSLGAGLPRSPVKHYLSAAEDDTSTEPLILTQEAVLEASGLADEVVQSIIRVLKDEAIYQEHPRVLARRILDLWGGERYRAVRWARTFSADVATNTSLYRFKQQGIEECQFYARIDGKTSPQCRTLHGTVFQVGSAEARQYRCPLHHNCRSVLLPVTSFSDIDDSLRYENRNFTKQVDQNFKVLDEGIDEKTMKKIFKEIDTFNEKWAVPSWVFDEDVEKRIAKLGVEVKVPDVKVEVIPEPIQETGLKYVPAKTIKEAEQWLLKNTSVKYADFKGVDIDIVNEMNERLVYYLNLAPEISEKMKFYGTGQAQFELWYQHELMKKVELLRKLYPEEDEKHLLKRAKIVVKKPKVVGYAHAWNHPKFGGIGVNKTYGGDSLEFSNYLDADVASGFHPIGCNTPKSTFDHEFGHVLDYVYKISDSNVVNDLYNKMEYSEIENELSEYATRNKKEFVAEAWAEYLNNPEPREVAKEMGKFITSKINEG